MKLSIVIISYNTRRLLEKCLVSIYNFLSQSKFKYEVIVVDNASSDSSQVMVKSKFPQVTLIENKKNLGFAIANNQGIKMAKGEYILLLNSDTEVKENAIEVLVKEAGKDKNIGVVGPKLVNPDGSYQPSVGYFPTIFKIALWMMFIDDIPIISKIIKPYHAERSSFYKKRQDVDWVSGACMLVKARALKKSGLFDEKIFMYGDEVELCFRIKESGYLILYTPEGAILHHKGASGEGKHAGVLEEFKFLYFFYKKYYPIWQFYLLRFLLYFGALLRWLLFGIILRQKRRAYLYAKFLKMVR